MRRVRPEPTPVAASSFADSLGEPDRREYDQRLLRALTDSGGLRDSEQDAFDDMLDALARGRRELSPAQREWAETVADRLSIDVGDPADRNADVPRGREVEAPDVLSKDSLKKALLAMRSRRGRTLG